MWDEESEGCICLPGYTELGGNCVPSKATCGANEGWDDESESCVCNEGYVRVGEGGPCVPDGTIDDAASQEWSRFVPFGVVRT